MSNTNKCAVRSCQSENNKLFRCPQSRNQSKKWKSILGLSEKEFYVCELHFDTHFISYEKVLSDEAVPTIFINDKLLVNQFCACCSNPISQGHHIGQLHLEIHRMLFSNFDLNGEFLCSNCNDKMVEVGDFIKNVEDSRRNFESLDVEMKELVVKIEPEDYDIDEESGTVENAAIFLKIEHYSDSEEESYETETYEFKTKNKRVRKRIRKCDICSLTSCDRDEFIEHIKTIHGAVDSNTNEMDYDLQLESDDPHAFIGTKQSRECDICREIFTDRKLLIEHFKAHFDKDRIYICPYCNKNCKGIVMLGYHKNLDHKEDKYYCICHRMYDREVVMKRCKKNHQITLVDTKYVCDECDSYIAFGDSLRLAHHKTKIHGSGTKFWCTVCLKSYSKEAFRNCLKQHRDAMASIIVKCPECNKPMQYCRVKAHRKDRHAGEKNEMCESCGLGFTSKSLLNNHRRAKHTAKDPNIIYECDFCGNKYNSKGYLLSHMSKHRYQETFQCSICLKKNLTKLDAHMKKSHPNNYDCGVRVNPETNLYHCPNCVQNFSSLKYYDRHVARNNCSIIGECEVDVTKKVGSRTVGKFPCKVCSTVLKSIIRLKVHMNQMHSGERVCPVCNKTSKNLKQLGKHVRSQHKMSMKDFRNV